MANEPITNLPAHTTPVGTDLLAVVDLAGPTTKKSTLNEVFSADTQRPTSNQKSALAGTSGAPGAGNPYVTDADARNTNARTPTTHATSHQSGGSDPIKLDDLATPDDNTDLDASLTRHGLVPKLPGGTTAFFRADGAYASPGASSLPVVDTTSIVEDPVDGTKEMRIDVGAVATATVRVLTIPNQDVDLTPNTGTFPAAAHATRHQSGGSDPIKLDDLAAPDDNTDLNVSTVQHGLVPKLPGGTTSFFRADGAYAVPAGGGNVSGPGSSGDNALVRFDGTTGTIIQDGTITESDTGALTFPDDVRQTFNPGSTVAGLNVGSISGDPSTPANGDLWYDSASNELTARINSANVALGAGGGTVNVGVCNGRLTLTTGVPVTTSDVVAASTLYFSPYGGNQVALYDGAAWQLLTFSELSLALTSLTSGLNYDVFIDYNGGTPQIVLTAWTNDTTRATALATQSGVLVKSGTPAHRYVGTIRTTSTTTTEDSGGGTTSQVGGKRFVWNYYNRVSRWLSVIDTTNTWNYESATIRQANGATGNKVEFVVGVSEDTVIADVIATVNLNAFVTVGAYVGIGLDTTTAFTGRFRNILYGSSSNLDLPIVSKYSDVVGIGYHYLAWLEKSGVSSGDCTFLGDNGADGTQSGLSATMMG